jgi:lipopolysaccharide exporter
MIPKQKNKTDILKNNYWFKSGFYSLLNQLTAMGFNLGTVAILFRSLDKTTCGEWVIYLTITAFIEIGRTGLLQNGLITYLNISPMSEHRKINAASLFLNLTISIISVVVLLLGGDWVAHFMNAPSLSLLLSLYAATTFCLLGLCQFNFIQQANLDFKGLFWSSFVKNGLLFGYVLYIKLSHGTFELWHLGVCQLVAAFPATLIAYMFAKPYFRLSISLDWAWVTKLFNYGKYTFGTNIATMAYKNVDKFMLGHLLLGLLSTYDLSIKINNLAEVPSMTLAAILFPQSAKRNDTEGGNSSKYLYEKGVGVLLAIILPIVLGIIIFADIIIFLIGGEKYANSAPILRMTIFYGIFMVYGIQFGTILDSIGKPKLNFYICSLGAVVNLVCNYFFIKAYGLYGAVTGSLIAITIMFVVMQVILRKMLNVNTLNAFIYMIQFYKDMYQKVLGGLKKRR